jgi:pimeloyl-ACP methyl ester carboxylesterase
VTPRLRSLLGLSLGGFHRVAYWEWGREDAERTVVCVHGLTRQGRDFDVLARALVREGCRVVCPDLVGRGRSDWLHHPAGYTLLQYGADMNALLACLAAAEDYLRTTLAPFGTLTDAQWHHLTEHSVHHDGEGGGYRLHHDPGIAEAYRPWRLGSIVMWELWDRVRCPTLLLRGALSDMLRNHPPSAAGSALHAWACSADAGGVLAAVEAGDRQCQGSSSCRRRIGWPAMRSRTSASQACGSMSFSLAVPSRV